MKKVRSDRRLFIQKLSLLILGGGFPKLNLGCDNYGIKNGSSSLNLKINSYYFRAQMYSCIPSQIEEDFKIMKDCGTSIVSLAILEQDLWAADRNLDTIFDKAVKFGFEIWMVPSRWGGLFAGAPKVPSIFSVTNPETWVLDGNGLPLIFPKTSGVISSIIHPKTESFFLKSLDDFLTRFSFNGIIWDEPKFLHINNHHFLNGNDLTEVDPVVEGKMFLDKLNIFIKNKFPSIQIALFIPASERSDVISVLGETKYLDYFGCDGRPWSSLSGGSLEGPNKTILDNGTKFLKACKDNNIRSLFLIENHNLRGSDLPLLDEGLKKVLALNPHQIIYYYYPRNVEYPQKAMEIVFNNIKNTQI